jgi:hypothetical protein
MTTIKAAPFKTRFQKEMHTSNLAKKVSKVYPTITHYCFPRYSQHHQPKIGVERASRYIESNLPFWFGFDFDQSGKWRNRGWQCRTYEARFRF